MSIIYALVGTNRALRHSNSNNQIVIGDFNSFRFFWDTLYTYINTRGNWENSKMCENTPPSGGRVST